VSTEIEESVSLDLDEEILLDCYTKDIEESFTTLEGYATKLQASVVAIVPIYSGFITLVAGFRENFQFSLWLLAPIVPLILAYLFCTTALLPQIHETSFDKYREFRNNRIKIMVSWFRWASILFAIGLLGMPAGLILFLN